MENNYALFVGEYMSSPNNFNQSIIEEFRANGGKVGAPFVNGSLLLLTSVGAKSGQPRINPLAYISDGDHLAIVASKAGAPTNPDWYYNLLANPLATVEVGSERFQVRAAVAEEQERERLYTKMVERIPGFAAYQQKTSRKIPVVILSRV
jgi:deazaflavin-dependent oxidoreductase (nitroreductase family)